MRLTLLNVVMFGKTVIAKLIQYIYWFNYLYNVHFNRVEPEKPTFAQTQQILFDKSFAKYQEFYENNDNDVNSNIDPILYDYDKRKEIFEDPNNTYEKMWKSRVLYANTPRGNVLMYYNPYSLSFTYHSDEQIIPYNILQKLALKYVVMFRCRDFYVDSSENRPNKLFDLLKKEDEQLKNKKTKVNDITKVPANIKDTGNVFASLKDYRTPVSTNPTPAQKPLPNANFSNKFVRIGKITDFNILALPPSKKVQATNELLFGSNPVSVMNDFFDDLDIVENPFTPEEPAIAPNSYAMFKKLKAKAE